MLSYADGGFERDGSTAASPTAAGCCPLGVLQLHGEPDQKTDLCRIKLVLADCEEGEFPLGFLHRFSVRGLAPDRVKRWWAIRGLTQEGSRTPFGDKLIESVGEIVH